MKRLVVVLSSLLVLPAFAEVAPFYYEDVIEMSDMDVVDVDYDANDVESLQNNSGDATTGVSEMSGTRNSGRAATSRAMANSGVRNGTRTNVTNGVASNSTRNLSTRASANSNPTMTARTAASRASTTRAGTSSRTISAPGAAANVASRGVTPSRNVSAGVNSARSATPATAARASIVQTDTVNKPLYTGRVGMAGSVRARVPAVRMATASVATSTTTTTSNTEATSETRADTAATMDELAQMSNYCKSQYMQCMDNFCNVLDDNQGRCTCSANIKNYAKTESALKDATESLQNVAQQIQYIGLSGDEVKTLFEQTEAELAMAGNSDTSQLKNDLDRIKNMIVGVKGGTASVTDTGMSFDLSGLLDFSINSTGFDLGSLFSTNNKTETSSISNQRGAQLYKTAASRCKAAVLNTCASQGVDISVITNSYDMEIDKQCIAYERALTDANDQMTSTVRNAKSVLQKARLMVAQQKNSYDLRGCVNALDTCMQDEFVCGTDYENCLDPTGKYLVNGEVVLGGQPGVSGGLLESTTTKAPTSSPLYSVWDYTTTGTGGGGKSAFGNGNVPEYVGTKMITAKTGYDAAVKSANPSIVEYLQTKIGYNEGGKNVGMCISVLNKCQDYTYTGTGSSKTYKWDNDVVRNYLERVAVQIKSAQDEKLASYAESCISDVSACLSQNNYTSLTVTTTDGKVSAVSVAACRPVINTCMSVTGYGTNVTSRVYNWLHQTLGAIVTGTYGDLNEVKNEAACAAIHGTWASNACTCKTGLTFRYGNCECTDDTKTWDDATSTCK